MTRGAAGFLATPAATPTSPTTVVPPVAGPPGRLTTADVRWLVATDGVALALARPVGWAPARAWPWLADRAYAPPGAASTTAATAATMTALLRRCGARALPAERPMLAEGSSSRKEST